MTAIAATTVGQTDHTDRYIMGGYPYEQRGSRIVVIKLTGTTDTGCAGTMPDVQISASSVTLGLSRWTCIVPVLPAQV